MAERRRRPRAADLFVDVTGDPQAPAVVFVHGGGPSGRMWRLHLDALGDRFHCLAPDLPGFGRSNHLPAVSLAESAALVAELIETQVPTRRASVVGLSYGGSVALALLGTRAALLDRVVVDGAGVLRSRADPLVLAAVTIVSPVINTWITPVVLGRLGLRPLGEELRTASPRAFRRAFAEGWVAPLADALLEAACPTLLVGGEKERTVRASDAALATLLPHAAARFMPGLGHAWFASAPEVHIRTVAAWLSDQELPAELEVEPDSPQDVARVLARLSSAAASPARSAASAPRSRGRPRTGGSAAPPPSAP